MTACLLFRILVGNLEKVYQGMPLVVQRYFSALQFFLVSTPCMLPFSCSASCMNLMHESLSRISLEKVYEKV